MATHEEIEKILYEPVREMTFGSYSEMRKAGWNKKELVSFIKNVMSAFEEAVLEGHSISFKEYAVIERRPKYAGGYRVGNWFKKDTYKLGLYATKVQKVRKEMRKLFERDMQAGIQPDNMPLYIAKWKEREALRKIEKEKLESDDSKKEEDL